MDFELPIAEILGSKNSKDLETLLISLGYSKVEDEEANRILFHKSSPNDIGFTQTRITSSRNPYIDLVNTPIKLMVRNLDAKKRPISREEHLIENFKLKSHTAEKLSGDRDVVERLQTQYTEDSIKTTHDFLIEDKITYQNRTTEKESYKNNIDTYFRYNDFGDIEYSESNVIETGEQDKKVQNFWTYNVLGKIESCKSVSQKEYGDIDITNINWEYNVFDKPSSKKASISQNGREIKSFDTVYNYNNQGQKISSATIITENGQKKALCTCWDYDTKGRVKSSKTALYREGKEQEEKVIESIWKYSEDGSKKACKTTISEVGESDKQIKQLWKYDGLGGCEYAKYVNDVENYYHDTRHEQDILRRYNNQGIIASYKRNEQELIHSGLVKELAHELSLGGKVFPIEDFTKPFNRYVIRKVDEMFKLDQNNKDVDSNIQIPTNKEKSCCIGSVESPKDRINRYRRKARKTGLQNS